MQAMEQDIVIIRDGDTYRLLHGHLRLANILRGAGEAWVTVPESDRVRITQGRQGYRVASGTQQFPLICG